MLNLCTKKQLLSHSNTETFYKQQSRYLTSWYADNRSWVVHDSSPCTATLWRLTVSIYISVQYPALHDMLLQDLFYLAYINDIHYQVIHVIHLTHLQTKDTYKWTLLLQRKMDNCTQKCNNTGWSVRLPDDLPTNQHCQSIYGLVNLRTEQYTDYSICWHMTGI